MKLFDYKATAVFNLYRYFFPLTCLRMITDFGLIVL